MIELMTILFLGTLGLIIGSFIGALSYRLPRNEQITKGRSKCPKCNKKIEWYDNIPFFSYLILNGKCRHCHKKISIRYPVIELTTSILFILIYINKTRLIENVNWLAKIQVFSIPFLLIVTFLLIAIFVIDWEFQIIPDELVFAGLIFTILFMMLGKVSIYENLLAGVVSGLFLLFINLATKGKGMGLGDVKLALFIGTLIGLRMSLYWYFLSFLIGGIYAIFVVLVKSKRLKDKVAFAPFLLIGLLVTLILPTDFFYPFFPFLY